MNCDLTKVENTVLRIFKKIRDTVVAAPFRFWVVLTLVLFVGVLLTAVLASRSTLTVRPVSLPHAFVEAGYSPNAASQAIASRMAYVGDLAQAESLAIGGALRIPRAAVGAEDLPDIQMPGQQFSFRDARRFMLGVFGNGDPTISVSIVRPDRHQIVVRTTAVGGVYNGRRAFTSIRHDAALDDVMLTAAALAVSVVEPLRYAAFLRDRANRPRCPVGLICTSERALHLVGQLLADDYLEDDGRAHLLYASLSLEVGRTADALQHCNAAAAYEESRDWAFIYCSYSHLSDDKLDRAMEVAMDALPVYSKDPDVYAGFGDLFLDISRRARERQAHGRKSDAYERAREAYDRALQHDGRHVYSMIGLGTVDRLTERFQEAAAHYRGALLVNPNEPYAHGGLGASLCELGEADKAVIHARRALAVAPKYSVAKETKRKAEAGCCVAKTQVAGTGLGT